MHSYKRCYPVYANNVSRSYDDPEFTVHMVIGGAGCDEMTTGTVEETDGVQWLAASNADYGMGILNVRCEGRVGAFVCNLADGPFGPKILAQVVNDTRLVWQWFSSDNGTLLDEMVITKPLLQ